MRVVVVGLLSLLLASAAVAEEHADPTGNLAELMRAILFPNSNYLFDVQTVDPGAPPEAEEGGRETTTQMFSGIYTGWQVVEQAAVALASVEPLILMPRKCSNGKDAPVEEEDYQEWAKELTAVSKKVYAAAKAKDRDAVIELTNDVAGACELCHEVYRRYPESQRCQ